MGGGFYIQNTQKYAWKTSFVSLLTAVAMWQTFNVVGSFSENIKGYLIGVF